MLRSTRAMCRRLLFERPTRRRRRRRWGGCPVSRDSADWRRRSGSRTDRTPWRWTINSWT